MHAMAVLTVLLIFVWADDRDTSERFLGGLGMDGDHLFNWHPVFMTWGMVCIVEGTLSYRTIKFYQHKSKKRMHVVCRGSDPFS